jgi:hypothetical protein
MAMAKPIYLISDLSVEDQTINLPSANHYGFLRVSVQAHWIDLPKLRLADIPRVC